ncbi:MAG: hypothetical protein JXR40_02470 [Pontiellaceae bacterium]|nr:hypothetical protein [Pontiellaceae bacterium]
MKKFSSIGLVISILALTAAFLSPWIIDKLTPPKSTKERAVELVKELKKAILEDESTAQKTPKEKNPGWFVAPTVIGFSMLGVVFGVIGTIREEKTLPGRLAIGLGVAAATVQWSLLLVGALIIVLLLAAVLISLGASP